MNLRSLTTVLLLIAIIALGGVFGEMTDWGRAFSQRVTPPKVAPGAAKEAALLPPFRLAFDDATSHKLMVERPLFSPTRAAAPPAVAPVAAAPTMQRGKYILTGAIVAADVRAAYLREVAGNKSHSIKQGDMLPDGYRIELVEARKVVLRFNNETEELEVQSGPRVATAGSPAAAPQGFVAPLSPYSSTIDRPIAAASGLPPVPGIPGISAPVAGVQPQPGIYPPGVVPPAAVAPQGVATGTPGFPTPQGVVPPAQSLPTTPAQPGTPASTDANPPARRRMWQNAQ